MIILGVDIGTTHTKVCLLDDTSENAFKIFRQQNHHGYDSLSRQQQQLPLGYKEQDPVSLVQSIDTCLSDFGEEQISRVAVTGQMHGVILWKPKIGEKIGNSSHGDSLISLMRNTVEKHSNLVTWEDQRCDQNFLKTLPKSGCHRDVATGYGSASLLWLAAHQKLEDYTMCGTIMDFLVWLMTQSDRVEMTVHNAKSWGYFDEKNMIWETDL